METPKPETPPTAVIVVHGIDRLGLEYSVKRFGMRGRVERFFRYLKERTVPLLDDLENRSQVRWLHHATSPATLARRSS